MEDDVPMVVEENGSQVTAVAPALFDRASPEVLATRRIIRAKRPILVTALASFERASPEVMATRRIIRARRPVVGLTEKTRTTEKIVLQEFEIEVPDLLVDETQVKKIQKDHQEIPQNDNLGLFLDETGRRRSARIANCSAKNKKLGSFFDDNGHRRSARFASI